MFDTGRQICAPSRRPLLIVVLITLALGACGGDDDGPVTDDPAAQTALDTVPAYDLPDDYPLNPPAGGTVLSSVFDDESGTSRVVVSYPPGTESGLIIGFDAFFEGVEGATERVPLADGLASWVNESAGYSVVLNAQNADVQVTLQTGV